MEKIASFTINHNILKEGMYISRIDGDIITYDIRCKRPNNKENDYIDTKIAHTIEHLFATYIRNSKFSSSIIYFGPMGCRTGFYLLVRDNMTQKDALNLTLETFKFISNFEGEIPGSSAIECGNYLEHDLLGAKSLAKFMVNVLQNKTVKDMQYD